MYHVKKLVLIVILNAKRNNKKKLRVNYLNILIISAKKFVMKTKNYAEISVMLMKTA